jgi:uncharacterized protein YkwD
MRSGRAGILSPLPGTPGSYEMGPVRMTGRVAVVVAGLLLAGARSGAGVPPPAPHGPDLRTADLESRILALVNGERAAGDAPELRPDAALSEIARAHSADMVRRKYFGHVDPEGNGPSERGELAGFECRRRHGQSVTVGLAENIYQAASYDRFTIRNGVASYAWKTVGEIAAAIVEGWMKSRGHRRNILKIGPSRTGVGVAISPDGKILVTQLFC